MGTLRQLLLTKAYNSAPAALNSAVGFAQPVASMAFGIVCFGLMPDIKGIFGAAVVVCFGVMLHFYIACQQQLPLHQV
jgi:drug/metabolite transporter (DMT)-like permease